MRILVAIANYGFCIVITKNSYIHYFGEGSIGKVLTADQITERHLSARRFIDSLYGC